MYYYTHKGILLLLPGSQQHLLPHGFAQPLHIVLWALLAQIRPQVVLLIEAEQQDKAQQKPRAVGCEQNLLPFV